MYEELSSKEVRPRKNRICDWCAEAVEKGTLCHYRSYISEDGPQSGWMHLECRKAMDDTPIDEFTEEWSPGDYRRGSTEHT